MKKEEEEQVAIIAVGAKVGETNMGHKPGILVINILHYSINQGCITCIRGLYNPA